MRPDFLPVETTLKTLLRITSAWTLVLLCTLPAWGTARAEGELLDRIVAVVNDDVITQQELTHEIAQVKKQLQAQNTRLPSDEVLSRQLLDRMILRQIQLQMAERANMRVDDDTLNNTVANIARQNGLSLEQFRAVLEKDGMDYTRYREYLRDEILIGRLQKRQVHDQISITPQEIDSFLANEAAHGGAQLEYHLGHILISVPEAASAEDIAKARKKAEAVLADLRKGADFQETAVAVSEGRQAMEGGDLGWRRGDALPSLFADWVVNQQPGAISDLIRSPSGFHIIKLLETRSNQPQFMVKQTHARHILVKVSDAVSEEMAKHRILSLKQRLDAGEDFAELARANSDDPGSAADGGDLGWFGPGTMVEPFEKAMDALAPGEISAPVQTRFGWHIIQVLERREVDNTDAMRRSKAMDAIRARKLEPALESWLRRIRDEAYVENRLQ